MSARAVAVPGDLDRIRIALEAAIARSSLRAVARRVGMSPTGLTNFLYGGGKPYGKTLERVRNWYYSEAGLQQLRPDEIAGLLRRVVGTLPMPDVGVAIILEAVDRSYHSAGMMPPEWVRGVRELLRSVSTA